VPDAGQLIKAPAAAATATAADSHNTHLYLPICDCNSCSTSFVKLLPAAFALYETMLVTLRRTAFAAPIKEERMAFELPA
jgi:hypothetical protein